MPLCRYSLYRFAFNSVRYFNFYRSLCGISQSLLQILEFSKTSHPELSLVTPEYKIELQPKELFLATFRRLLRHFKNLFLSFSQFIQVTFLSITPVWLVPFMSAIFISFYSSSNYKSSYKNRRIR